MIEANYIKSEDLEKLEKDASGNYIIPTGIKIYIEEDPSILKQKRIEKLENELSSMREPTEQELIDEGKLNNPYYMILDELNYLKR